MLATWGTSTFPKPTLLLDFLGASSLDAGITFTRASGATFFNSAGVLSTASNNVPRLDYNPSTLAPLGLLIEEQRTNLFPASNDFANATYWTVYGTAVATAGAGTGPDGLNSAVNLAGATDITLSGNNIEESLSVSASTAYQFSVFVKSNGGTTVILRLRDSTGGSSSSSPFTVTSSWTRISLNRTMAVGATSVRCIIGATDGDILIYGAQLEAGAFATSYIPTTTTALTRNADVASMTGTNFSSWYNASSGSLLAQYQPSVTGVNLGTVAISDGTLNNRMIIRGMTTSSQTVFIGVSSGSTQWNDGFTTATATSTKSIFAYATNDIAFTRNAATPFTDTSATIPTVNQLRIGSDADGTFLLNGHIQRLAFYPQRLPNATLQALTS